jgi:hypothetical protein
VQYHTDNGAPGRLAPYSNGALYILIGHGWNVPLETPIVCNGRGKGCPPKIETKPFSPATRKLENIF